MIGDLQSRLYSLEAEQFILGSFLIDNKMIVKAYDHKLQERDFYSAKNQIIFKAILDLYNSKQNLDFLTVFEKVKSYGLSDLFVTKDFLDLTDSVVTFEMFSHYVEILKEKAYRRNVIEICRNISEMAYNLEKTKQEIDEQMQSDIFKLTQDTYTNDLENMDSVFKVKQQHYLKIGAEGYKEELDTRKRLKHKSLYEYIAGVENNDLVIIAGRPAMGKTAYSIDLALDFAERHKKSIAIFSMEMNKESIADRMIASQFGISSYELKVKGVRDNYIEPFNETITKLSNLGIYCDDKGSLSTAQIKNSCRKLKTRLAIEGKELGLIVVDYLQLCESKGDTRQNEVAKIARDLKAIAQSLNVPVIALSQLSNEVEKRADKRPQLSDLKETGEISAAADIVKFIYRDEYYNQKTDKRRIAEIIIAKNRKGKVGTAELYFDATLTSFRDLEFK